MWWGWERYRFTHAKNVLYCYLQSYIQLFYEWRNTDLPIKQLKISCLQKVLYHFTIKQISELLIYINLFYAHLCVPLLQFGEIIYTICNLYRNIFITRHLLSRSLFRLLITANTPCLTHPTITPNLASQLSCSSTASDFGSK